MKTIIKFTLLGATALAVAGANVNAADKAESPEAKKSSAPISKAERTGVSVTFHGTLAAKTDASITIGEQVIEVTSETKITKNDKPATMADGEVGKFVSGQYRKRDGKLIARTIHFGGTGVTKTEKVKKEKPAAKPEVKPETKPEVKPDAAPAK